MTTVIEHPAAYERAVETYIQQNAIKGRRQRWLAEDPSRVELITAIFAGAGRSNFFLSLRDALDQWGSLTERQEAAARTALARDAERAVARKAANDASGHVGTVGKRCRFTAHVTFVTSFDSEFGRVYVTGFRDAAGNVLIAKGQRLEVEKGEEVSFAAFVKGHGEREGVKQTLINRVKIDPAVAVAA